MSRDVDEKIESLGDWRGALLARLRTLILAVDPEIVEEIKWRKPTNPLGVPTWSLAGIICTGETYKDKVKLTFMNGAAIPDPNGLFNASLEGVRRAIDFKEGVDIDEATFSTLVRDAVATNLAAKRS